MLDSLKNLFSSKPPVDYKALLEEGAIIIDVRSKGEYAGGHIQKSKNIPLDTLGNQLAQLKDKNQIIITCCASGMRSGSAKSLLQSKGYTNVYNGGGWSGLNGKI
ncbi:Rhodanese-related sulfurtransferase [Bernardetia litoralis DSM 6794]|uniref:Rhodanese-related sulfurtransferase n=1 Tax=Bernardetia litoralis (strain ATCC 23117 / DSM 6794 / NBRC 15988 / NCIMB 1366 / Fx l1 / Sio-4) TaxID=880071 RepID=I4AI26_BERLS|nr:rhodanese-like domain-containing protein [Bernardetia litoralis]AFM03611.1 Rhodanese-related sulfurtransferase [Bernardetia litoralis DSM 6794]